MSLRTVLSFDVSSKIASLRHSVLQNSTLVLIRPVFYHSARNVVDSYEKKKNFWCRFKCRLKLLTVSVVLSPPLPISWHHRTSYSSLNLCGVFCQSYLVTIWIIHNRLDKCSLSTHSSRYVAASVCLTNIVQSLVWFHNKIFHIGTQIQVVSNWNLNTLAREGCGMSFLNLDETVWL